MMLPTTLLAPLSSFVAEKLGLAFPPERWSDLERALVPAALESGFADVESYARWLPTASLTPRQMETLTVRLTVGETYFYREAQAFDALRESILPELIAARRAGAPRLRVWSAGCCTGEEAYSLAIFFERHCPELLGWQIDIVASDVNPHFLARAREGVYRSWSFRGAPAWLQAEYFTPLPGDRFELRADIRRKVTFEHLNLVDAAFPSLFNQTNGLDLIFCRNVLMYFSPAQVRRVIDGFHRSLIDVGHLVVGVCEVSSALCPQFTPRVFPGVTLYRKGAPTIASARNINLTAALPPPSEPLPVFEPLPALVRRLAPRVEPTTAQVLERARNLIQNGEFAEAVARLEALLTRSPMLIEAATLLAQAFADQGQLAAARRWIERALQMDRLYAPLHHLHGVILQEEGKIDAAVHALERALYLDPGYVLSHLALAELERRSGRDDKARRHLEAALRVLRRRPPGEVVAEAGELTVARLIAVIEAMQTTEIAR